MVGKRSVSVWLGTRKGAYVVRSNAARKKWTVHGPFQDGSDVFHVAPDPRHPGTVYSAANNGWWGPALYRSRDSGKKWTEVSVPGTPRFGERKMTDGEPPAAKFPIKNLWHIEPGPPGEPKSVFLGVDPAALYRSDDEGAHWEGVSGINEHSTRSRWNPGAGGLCLHTILIDPQQPRRMYIGISAAGTFKTEDGGAHWSPCNKGVETPFLPEKFPELGQCVHKVALDPEDPSVLYRQDHGGIYVSRDRADHWTRVGKPLPEDFGFVVATAAGRPGEATFIPEIGESRTAIGGQFQVYRWHRDSKKWSPLVRKGLFPGFFGVHREGMAIDDLPTNGIYVGSTTGTLVVSPDYGRTWSSVPYQFPGIHSVSVSTA